MRESIQKLIIINADDSREAWYCARVLGPNATSGRHKFRHEVFWTGEMSVAERWRSRRRIKRRIRRRWKSKKKKTSRSPSGSSTIFARECKEHHREPTSVGNCYCWFASAAAGAISWTISPQFVTGSSSSFLTLPFSCLVLTFASSRRIPIYSFVIASKRLQRRTTKDEAMTTVDRELSRFGSISGLFLPAVYT